MPTDDPKDPAPRRRKRATAAATDAADPAAAETGAGKTPRARKPAASATAKTPRAKRTKAAETVESAETVEKAIPGSGAKPGSAAGANGSRPATEVDAAATDAPNGVDRSMASVGGTADAAAGETVGQDAEAQAAHRGRVEATLQALLERMSMPATLDVRDLPDGTFSVAVYFTTLPPGVVPGRRSPFMDSLQFLTNKLLHPPRTPGRRWVTLGAMEHLAPRGPKPVKAQGSAAAAEPTPERRKGRDRGAVEKGGAETPARVDERHLEVEPDPALAAAAIRLAEGSARFGRLYTVLGLNEVDRARVVQAAGQVDGLRVSCEGEGRHRRVSFRPDNPVPLPKRTIPDWDDDEDVD